MNRVMHSTLPPMLQKATNKFPDRAVWFEVGILYVRGVSVGTMYLAELDGWSHFYRQDNDRRWWCHLSIPPTCGVCISGGNSHV